MSWTKGQRPSPGLPAAGQNMYNPTQPPMMPVNQAQHSRANYQQGYQQLPTNQPLPQQQYWQPRHQDQPINTGQMYNQNQQNYPQQNYQANNGNDYYSQYQRQDYPNQNQPRAPQSTPNYSGQPHYNQQKFNPTQYPDSGPQQGNWELNETDPWNWGWEDNSANLANTVQSQKSIPQQTNANILNDSFSVSDSWNWQPENTLTLQSNIRQEEGSHTTGNYHEHSKSNIGSNSTITDIHHNPKPRSSPFTDNSVPIPSAHSSRTPNRDDDRHQSPALPLSTKNLMIENLPLQWSTESQASQDSTISDGLISNTESHTRSDQPSRNSNKSASSLSTSENINFNYTQNVLDIGAAGVSDTTVNKTEQKFEDLEINQEVASSIAALNLDGNRENITPDGLSLAVATLNDPLPVPTPPLTTASATPPILQPPQQFSKNPTPPLLQKPILPSAPSDQNPFKRAGPLSHKTSNRAPVNAMVPHDNPPPPMQMPPMVGQREPGPMQRPIATNLASPSVVNKVIQQQRTFGSYEPANLEVTPDNSEQPDLSPPLNFRSHTTSQPLQNTVTQNSVDNLEVPANDRNEYLQTGHLSEGDYSENFQNVGQPHNILPPRPDGGFPPPGLRRMVLGQPEVEFNQSANISGDEPPPGLSRMVPGQLTDPELYNQSSNDYMDRQIDGQNTENDASNSTNNDSSLQSYRQVEGELTQDTLGFNPGSSRSERRPIGLDRMVPGEPSTFNRVQQFPSQNFSNSSDHQRYVTGLEHESATVIPFEIREQNVDGSDYTETQPRNLRQSDSGLSMLDIQGQSTPAEPSIQREVEMEGENLHDLSIIASNDYAIAHPSPSAIVSENKPVVSSLLDSGSEKVGSSVISITTTGKKGHKYVNTSEDSEKDKVPKREKDRHRPSKDKESRYNRERDDRKSERRWDDRDSDKHSRDNDRDKRSKDRDRRGKDGEYRDESRVEGDRRYRRSTRDRRYETEDTDYNSERESRRHRESSSRPPAHPDERDRRYRDEKDRYKSKGDRDRRYKEYYYKDDYDSERDRRHRDRDRDGRDRRYRDDDRSSRYGTLERDRNTSSLKKSREERDRNRETHSSPSRPSSSIREKDKDSNNILDTTGDSNRPRDKDRWRERDRRTVDRDRDDRRDRDRNRERDHDVRNRRDRHYSSYHKYQDQYTLQLQQYEYYNNLRHTNPAAYMEIYRNYGAVTDFPSLPGYAQEPVQTDDRGSVHSGMSSNGANKNRSLVDGAGYYYQYRPIDPALVGRRDDSLYLGRAPSLRTDNSGSRDFTTDMSLQLEVQSDIHTTTAHSDRQTPMKFPTAHIKGSISSTNMVMISPTYPVDGQPAMIEILDLNAVLADDPIRCELTEYPGPLIKDTTHKKTIIDFCELRIRSAISGNSARISDRPSYQRQLSNSSSGSPAQQDLASFVLMWELLILLLRQNGRVVGADIAELLMKNKRTFEHKSSLSQKGLQSHGSGSRRNSAVSSSATSKSDQQLPSEENDNINLNSERTGDDAGSPADGETNDISLGQDTSHGSMQQNRRISRDNIKSSVKGTPTLTQNEAIEKFRDYLIFGNVKQGLEFAMSYGGVLWAHALQLAPSLDARLRAAVAARFVASLPPADPLATLHALLSAPPRQPRVITAISDERWGDWRPHLAIILANSSQRRDLDKKAILTLGDTLMSRGSLMAAHFCYLMADIAFGKCRATPFCRLTEQQTTTSRLVLLGLDLSRADSSSAVTNEGIFMTEIYEYACGLSSENFTLWEFQSFKYLLALRMTDYGLYEKALAYAEIITNAIIRNIEFYEYPFANAVLELADKLKYNDPDISIGHLSETGISPYSTEQPWITQLKQIVASLKMKDLSPDTPYLTADLIQQQQQQAQISDRKHSQTYDSQNWIKQNSFSEPQAPQFLNPNEYQNVGPESHSQLYQTQQENLPDNAVDPPSMYNPNDMAASYAHAQPDYIQTAPEAYVSHEPHQYHAGVDANQHQTSVDSNPYPGDIYWNRDSNQPTYGFNEEQTDSGFGAQQKPMISMPNAAASGIKQPSIFDDEFTKQNREDERSASGQQSSSQKSKDKKADVTSSGKSGPGWFGGIFNKLSLKPKNQMILPDDKNPTIVWDEDKQRWLDKDAGESESSGPPLPPPSVPMSNFGQSQLPSGAAGLQQVPAGMSPGMPPPGGNLFKMQKSRHIKKAYVDVFNPGGGAGNAVPAATPSLQSQMPALPQNVFVPGQDGQNMAQMTPGMYDQMSYN